MKKNTKRICIVLAVLAALYFMPFVTVNTTASDGRVWRVPFLSSFAEDDGSQLSFTSIRSAYALGKDAANAVHSYTSEKCYGKTYYYDAANDVSLSGYQTSYGLPLSTLRYTYEKGDACAGWTEDDEIAWPYTPLKDLDTNVTIQQAQDNEWAVVQDGVMIYAAPYNDFARLIKEGELGYLRTMIVDNGTTSWVDIQNMLDGTLKVTTLKDGELSTASYLYISDEDINGVTWVCAQNRSTEGIQSVPLFPAPIE
jgi:hypothetical protein